MDQSEIIYLVVRFWFWRGIQSLKFQDENLFQIRFTPVRTTLFHRVEFRMVILKISLKDLPSSQSRKTD